MAGLHVVEKRRTGRPSRWYVYAWRGGPCIHTTDGPRPTIGPELLALAMAERGGGRTRQGTIDGLITDYEAAPEFTRLRDSTKVEYRRWLNRISARFGKAPLEAFEDRRMRAEVITWRDGWAHQPRAADTAATMLSTLLGWAVERGLLDVNVAARIPALHHADRADMVWEERHWQAVRALDKAGRPIIPAHVMDALVMASLTGLRLGDLVRMDWAQVGEKAIVIEKTRKRGSRALIPITPELRAHLDSRTHREGTVLQNSRGKAWTESGLETIWQRRKPEGFDRTIHDLRGTYVTRLAIKGLTDQEIARIIGWTAQRIAEIRARYVDEARVVISIIDRLTA